MADDDPDAIEFGDPFADPDARAWDADDSRRQKDQFAPPTDSCECYCLHCNRVFMSDQIWFQRVIGDCNGFEGFWMCPTPNCGGAGFTFDIFPTDPNHPANAGWCDDDEEQFDSVEFEDAGAIEIEESAKEWDPDEPLYRRMDQHDEDIEGEEWKYGLEPGEQRADMQRTPVRRNWDNPETRYDQPDERPRELDWSNREDQEGPITEDDIPF